jgi:hypothetical protein
MLDLVSRSDLAELGDAKLAERLDLALQAHESMKRRYGFLYFFYALSWQPRIAVHDPREYWFPSHVVSEIQDIKDEMERRIAERKVHIS